MRSEIVWWLIYISASYLTINRSESPSWQFSALIWLKCCISLIREFVFRCIPHSISCVKWSLPVPDSETKTTYLWTTVFHLCYKSCLNRSLGNSEASTTKYWLRLPNTAIGCFRSVFLCFCCRSSFVVWTFSEWAVDSNFEKMRLSPPNDGLDFQNTALVAFNLPPHFLLQ